MFWHIISALIVSYAKVPGSFFQKRQQSLNGSSQCKNVDMGDEAIHGDRWRFLSQRGKLMRGLSLLASRLFLETAAWPPSEPGKPPL